MVFLFSDRSCNYIRACRRLKFECLSSGILQLLLDPIGSLASGDLDGSSGVSNGIFYVL